MGRRKTSAAVAQQKLNLRTQCLYDELMKVIRKQLSPLTSFPLPRYDEHKRHLTELIQRTATMGESNSALIIGPRGAGKTALLENIKKELFELPDIKENLLCIELNGLVHSDDNIALMDITRQLKLENVVGDKVFGSFAETMIFLLEAIRSGSHCSKSLLFILDEFDLFCHHKNQTLLYNLFDTAQAAYTPVVILGLTCRLDVTELLEKRVKSRFSHRQIYLFNKLSFEEYIGIAETLLSLPANFTDKEFREAWNTNIKNLFLEQSIQTLLRQLFELNKDIRALQQHLLLPVAMLKEDHLQIEPSDFFDAQPFYSLDSKAAMLHGLSILEFTLVITMMHLSLISDGDPFNFEMVYHEYQKFAQKKASVQHFDKVVILKAFEHLQMLEFVQPAEGHSTQTLKQYCLMRLLVEPEQIREAVLGYSNLPTELHQWALAIIAQQT